MKNQNVQKMSQMSVFKVNMSRNNRFFIYFCFSDGKNVFEVMNLPPRRNIHNAITVIAVNILLFE